MLRICSLLVLILVGVAQADVGGAARVIDGDTLDLAGTRVRLFGIDAPELSQHCEGPHGDWPCGLWARDRLRHLVADQPVRCQGDSRDRYGRLLARCWAGPHELGAAMVGDGAALAFRRYSLAYVEEEARARVGARGLWRRDGAGVQAPEDYRAARRSAAAGDHDTPPADAGCVIKGNVSASGRIYHRPGQQDYERTRIDPARGEHWFCSENEARAAGWRPALR